MTDYAVVILSRLAKDSGAIQTAAEISNATGIPLPTVSKILKIMGRASLISSHRGASGGYSLKQSAYRIRVSDIIETFEGPVALTACVVGAKDQCSVEALCPIRGNWNKVNEAIRLALESLTLAELLDPRESIQGIMGSEQSLAKLAYLNEM